MRDQLASLPVPLREAAEHLAPVIESVLRDLLEGEIGRRVKEAEPDIDLMHETARSVAKVVVLRLGQLYDRDVAGTN